MEKISIYCINIYAMGYNGQEDYNSELEYLETNGYRVLIPFYKFSKYSQFASFGIFIKANKLINANIFSEMNDSILTIRFEKSKVK